MSIISKTSGFIINCAKTALVITFVIVWLIGVIIWFIVVGVKEAIEYRVNLWRIK